MFSEDTWHLEGNEVINWLQQCGEKQRKHRHRLVDAVANKQGANGDEHGQRNWRK